MKVKPGHLKSKRLSKLGNNQFSPNRFKKSNLVIFSLVFALIGAYIIFHSFASGFFASIEAENGTLATSATSFDDANASGGKAVQFGSSSGSSSTCPAFPAFPDVSCTGVPSGYSLTTVANLSSTSNGQTIDGKLITGDLTINNNNVTITNTRVKGQIINNGHSGMVLQNIDIGPDSCPGSGSDTWYAVDPNSAGFTLKQVRIHNIPNDEIRLDGDGPILIQDSLIGTTCYYPLDHLDALQWYDPGALGHVSIIHSNIDVRPINNTDKGNSAVFWADGAANGTTLTMYNNLFAGGQITTALYNATKGSGNVLDVHDNVYVKNSYASDGAPCSFGGSTKSIVFDGTSGVKYTNNKFDDGTAVTCN